MRSKKEIKKIVKLLYRLEREGNKSALKLESNDLESSQKLDKTTFLIYQLRIALQLYSEGLN